MGQLVLLKKGGGGRVAINPDHVTHVRSATGAFTDIFVGGQQVAVEGTFDEVVRLLSVPDRRSPQPLAPEPQDTQSGLAFIPPPR